MNPETEQLQNSRPTASLEELEKKYFKDNQQYYTNKEPETSFDKFEFSDKDLVSLSNQIGDQAHEDISADAEEGLAGSVHDNNVDVAQLRRDMNVSRLAMVRQRLLQKPLLIYLSMFLNAFIGLACLGSLWWGLSFALVISAATHSVFFTIVASAWVNMQQSLILAEERLGQHKGWLLRFDLFVALWTPCKGIILSLIFPHHNWSPLAPYAADNVNILISLAMVANFFVLRKVAK